MDAQRDGDQRCFRERKNKGPRQPPEANADRESPVRRRTLLEPVSLRKSGFKVSSVFRDIAATLAANLIKLDVKAGASRLFALYLPFRA